MSIGLRKKIGMTREFLETGQSIPVTVIKAEKAEFLKLIRRNEDITQ